MSIEGIGQYMQYLNPQQLLGDPSQRLDEMTSRLLGKKDANADGVLSLEEFSIPEDKFNKIDSDQDGLLTQDELKEGLLQKREAMMQPMQQMQGLMQGLQGMFGLINGDFDAEIKEKASEFMGMLDSDGDGSLTFDELGLSQDKFDLADKNGDSVIDDEEFTAGAKMNAMKKQMYGLMQGFEQLMEMLNGKQESSSPVQTPEDSLLSELSTVEILGNGIDDDQDGEIDEDDSTAALDDTTKDETNSSLEEDTTSIDVFV